MIRSITLATVAAILGAVVACGTQAGSSSATASCTSLAACCSAAGTEQALCVAIVASNVSTSCSSELVSLQAGGSCASTPPGSGTGGGSGCSALATCCVAMTGSAAQGCLAFVEQGVAATCTAELSAYESVGSCGKVGTGTGTGTGTACPLLAECCAEMTAGPGATACDAVVASGVSTSCATELSAEESAGACHGTGTGTGTGIQTGTTTSTHGQTGTGTNSQTGFTTGNTGTSSSSSSAMTCVPHALPAGYAPQTIGLTSGACTAAQDEAINTCVSNGTSCAASEVGSCGTCAFASWTSSSWGAVVNITLPGAGNVTVPFLNSGGCLQKASAAATACADASNKQFQCELEACVAYCPVASASDTVGLEAF